MAHVDIGIAGDSFYTVLRVDRNHTTGHYLVRPELLPPEISPFEKQLRVAVNGVEYTYDNTGDSSLTNIWTYTTPDPNPAQGVLCADIRVRMGNGIMGVAQFGIRDANGEWYTDLVFGVNVFVNGAGNEANLFDLDGTTQYSDTGSPVELFVVFEKPRVVSAFGWARSISGSAVIEEMEIAVNVGTNNMLRDDFDYKEAGSITGLTGASYTDPVNYNPDTDLLFIEVAASLGDEDDLSRHPVITVTPATTEDEDRVTYWRETRQDRPHNPPVSGARVDPENLHWFFMQRLFIAQDLCDYQALGPFIDFVPYTPDVFDFDVGNQKQFHLGGTTHARYLFNQLELLDGIPGVSNLGDQIIVEKGDETDGTSDFWLEVPPADYTVDSVARDIVLDTADDQDLRIRRVTKGDALWFDLRDKPPAWNSLIINLLQRQVRFLIEEACFVPTFFAGSILANTIFPREWNWLVYTGTALFHIFGGPFWTGDGEISVWDNDLKLTTPTDYTTEWPQIRFTGPITQPHLGSTGNYWMDGGDGVPGDEGEEAGQQEPPEDQSPIDPEDPIFNAGISIAIAISFVPIALVRDGPIEGLPDGMTESTSQGNATAFDNSMYLKIVLTINNTFAGQPTVGRQTVAYCNTVCNQTSFGLRSVVQMTRANLTAGYVVRESGDILGCLDGGAIVTNLNNMWLDWLAHRGAYSDRELVLAGERAMNSIFDAGRNNDLAGLLGTGAISGLTALVAQNQAGGSDGTTDPSDINGIMGP